MYTARVNYLPKLCVNCGKPYIGKGTSSPEDTTIEICPTCATKEEHLRQRLISGIGYRRQEKRYYCPCCSFHLKGTHLFQYITGFINIFYIKHMSGVAETRTIGFQCPQCEALSYALTSRIKNSMESSKIHTAIKTYLAPCPECGQSMLHQSTDWLRYTKRDGTLYVKDISCRMHFFCCGCEEEQTKEL